MHWTKIVNNNLGVEYMKHYLNMLESIETNGKDKLERTGTGTRSLHSYNFRHQMANGFPLMTTKFVSIKNVMTEWKWMMLGMTDVRWLQDHGCTIWDEWATISQCNKFDRIVGDLGPVYGHQWRNFGATRDSHTMGYMASNWFRQLKENWKNDGTKDTLELDDEYHKEYMGIHTVFDLRDSIIKVAKDKNVVMKPKVKEHYVKDKRTGNKYIYGYDKDGFDQIAWLIKELKFNPNSRRLIVTGWNPQEANEVALPPCHTMWQLHTVVESVVDGKEIGKRILNLSLHQRSGDTFLGVPYNIAFYGFMIEFFALMFDMTPGELVTNTIDAHIYWNHDEAVDTQKGREPHTLPSIEFDWGYIDTMRSFANSITKEMELKEIGNKFNELLTQLRINEDVYISSYNHHPSIKADVAV